MATYNTDYLKFDALSIKNLIKQKLSENTNFTDHVYEGSNLSILIDIVSNMYQVLIYNLNNAAGESSPATSQIFENLAKEISFIGYNVKGYKTANTSVDITYTGSVQGVLLPMYSRIPTNSSGTQVYYSTTNYFYLYKNLTNEDISINSVPMYNGEWTHYNTYFTSEGIPYEKFILTDITADSTSINPAYIAYPYLHVYVKRIDTNGNTVILQYTPNTTGLFIDNSNNNIFNENSRVFNLRLNEYKQYEITFGDNIHGASLQQGDIVHIVYLKSNGPTGELLPAAINHIKTDTSVLPLKASIVGIADRVYLNGKLVIENDPNVLTMSDILYCLYGDQALIQDNDTSLSVIKNNYASTIPNPEETVEQIRQNAPNWFKSQGRLITDYDFDSFVRTNFYNDLIDVKVMNNWTYITTFYKWLYIRGLIESDPYKYINPSLETAYGYKYADAADSNNIYLWIKPIRSFSDTLVRNIESTLSPLKPLTSEPVVLNALAHTFVPCVYNGESNDRYSIDNWDPDAENYFEVELTKNLLISITAVKTSIINTIVSYFNVQNQTIGTTIKVSDMIDKLLKINGVKRIRTVFKNKTNPLDVKYIDGLSFAHYTGNILNGTDLSVTNSNVSLEPFMFPELYTSNLDKYITIIVENTIGTNQIEY